MIDWNSVRTLRTEVGEDDFEEVVELFLQEVDSEIDELDKITSGRALGEKLHFLKGSAMSLGFASFSALCQEGEALLAASPDATINRTEILDSYAKSRSEFLQHLSEQMAP